MAEILRDFTAPNGAQTEVSKSRGYDWPVTVAQAAIGRPKADISGFDQKISDHAKHIGQGLAALLATAPTGCALEPFVLKETL